MSYFERTLPIALILGSFFVVLAPLALLQRLRIALGGTSPSATLEIWICGRSPNR